MFGYRQCIEMQPNTFRRRLTIVGNRSADRLFSIHIDVGFLYPDAKINVRINEKISLADFGETTQKT